MVHDDFQTDLDRANQRIARGNAERAAGADERARVIAREVDRRGSGGAAAVAAELGVTQKTISVALARARKALSHRGLPADTLERLFAVERDALQPLPPRYWHLLEHLLGSMYIDAVWIEADPGELLAGDVEESDVGDPADRAAVAAACRAWSRVQALAVIHAYHYGLIDELPAAHS